MTRKELDLAIEAMPSVAFTSVTRHGNGDVLVVGRIAEGFDQVAARRAFMAFADTLPIGIRLTVSLYDGQSTLTYEVI